jgi:sarcosine oxidase subunit gamma
MPEPARLSALSAMAGPARSVAEGLLIEEGPPVGAVVLRARGEGAVRGARAAAGLDLAVPPGRVAERPGLVALRLAPDEWLLLLEPGGEAALLAGLRKALAGLPGAAVAGGSGLVELVISGPRARDLLAKAICLDLHPAVFAPGRCAATGMGRVRAVLRQFDAAPRFGLYLTRSFALSIWDWAVDAAGEWRPPGNSSMGR